MKKRLVTLLLAITVTLSALTGCGNKTGHESNSGSSFGGNEVEEATSSEVEEAASYDRSRKNQERAQTKTTQDAQSYVNQNTTERAYDSAISSDDFCDIYVPDTQYGETYKASAENGFMSAQDSPLSTFAADVDTASYSNMRRMIENGYIYDSFPAGSIRTEELVNYFKYDYDKPEGKDVFGVDATVSDCPWNSDNKLLVLGITTKELKERQKPDSNIVFLVDVSGSMRDVDKLPLLKKAMEMMTERLSEDDRVSIVTYASGTEVVLRGASGASKDKINRAFDKLVASGSTFGSGGIELAYEVAQDYFIEGGNNRIIIASDGDFNVGLTSQEELYQMIREKKDTGIFLSVLGFGMGNYNDVSMETLADNGNGNYAYIDSILEAKKVLVDEFDSTVFTVAKDTKFQVEFNPALVSMYRQIGYENRLMDAADFTDDTKDGGEVGAGHQITVMYELILADDKSTKDGLKYQESNISNKGKASDEWCTLSIAYKQPDEDESYYLEYPIGVENYTKYPSDDYRFASSVAMYSMVLNKSLYIKDFSDYRALDEVCSSLSELDLDDEYKQEFYSLVRSSKGRVRNSWID